MATAAPADVDSQDGVKADANAIEVRPATAGERSADAEQAWQDFLAALATLAAVRGPASRQRYACLSVADLVDLAFEFARPTLSCC
jgi:hypothetical protein